MIRPSPTRDELLEAEPLVDRKPLQNLSGGVRRLERLDLASRVPYLHADQLGKIFVHAQSPRRLRAELGVYQQRPRFSAGRTKLSLPDVVEQTF